MAVTAVRKDGSKHTFINGKWEPPITAPAYIHERVLRKINDRRMNITPIKKERIHDGRNSTQADEGKQRGR